VPLLFPPVMLMTQDEHDERVPYMPLLRWNDGSLKSDLPILRLRRLHNVNHFIVSQTNPHVLPFVTRRTSERVGLGASLRDYGYALARAQAREFLNFGRLYVPGGIRPTVEAASSILEQDYSGHVTILPDISLWRYMRVTANPDPEAVERFILEGERATWPRLAMVRNQSLVAQTLARCLRRAEQELNAGEGRARELPNGRPGLRVVRKNA
jgi:NTE family protein